MSDNGEFSKEKLFDNIADIDRIDDIITQLEQTFKNQQIYVNFGYKNLISLNPFQKTQHLNDGLIQNYKKKFLENGNQQLDYQSQKPHIYELAEHAKQSCFSKQNEYNISSILTQGISGSGKTVASKSILDYIAADSESGQFVSSILSKVEIERRIISANTIFEAFGNARTKNNSNSSRFGKVFSIQFDKKGKISSGKIITTLFERTRLIYNRYSDRNYHIFYQLYTAYQKIEDLQKFANEHQDDFEYDIVQLVQEIQKLALDSEYILLGTQNSFLSSSDDQNKQNEDDVQSREHYENFLILLQNFSHLEFTLEEIVDLFQLIAGLIHLKEDNYQKAEELLKIPNLQEKINSNITEARQSKKLQAESIINGMIMDFYYKLFNWIQDKVNNNISQEYNVNKKYILNIFDSFGFEIFENEYGIQQNQFEQLMLNYINEKLQNFFYYQIVDNAEKKFKSESLTAINVDFSQNERVIAVIEEVIFKSLKDCILLSRNIQNLKEIIRKQTEEKNLTDVLIDETKLKKKQESLKSSQNAHKFEQNIICIRHTGGEIYYQLENFISSNKYSVSQELQNINQLSSNSIIKSFTPQSQNQTVADNTQKVVNEIIQMFKKSETWFVKCFQTNYQQIPNNFDKVAIRTQLNQSGLDQCAQYLYSTYFQTIPKEDFLKNYQIIYPNLQNIEDFINALNSQYQDQMQCLYLGQNNILIKEKLKRTLDNQKDSTMRKGQSDKTIEQEYEEKIASLKFEHSQEIQRYNQELIIKQEELKIQKQKSKDLKNKLQQMISIIGKMNEYQQQLNDISMQYKVEMQKQNEPQENSESIPTQGNSNNQVFGQLQ